jgi:hypothetical protein
LTRISRRSLLGYSGTTAAGAVLAGTASAQPAQAAQAAADTAAADFPAGTRFGGRASLSTGDDRSAELEIEFKVTTTEAPAANTITPLEIAKLLNDFAASRGWPPITFYGTPAPAPLN